MTVVMRATAAVATVRPVAVGVRVAEVVGAGGGEGEGGGDNGGGDDGPRCWRSGPAPTTMPLSSQLYSSPIERFEVHEPTIKVAQRHSEAATELHLVHEEPGGVSGGRGGDGGDFGEMALMAAVAAEGRWHQRKWWTRGRKGGI